MTGTRLALTIVFALALGFAGPAFGLGDGGGWFHRKARLDPARVRQLIDIIRSDPDEKKRKAAIADLADADPRLQVEVVPTLIIALRKDAAVAVRATAAEVIGRFNIIFPTAGVALEDALESDLSAEVRRAARQSLWEYHLLGFRSARGADGVAGQTAEPPIAKPARPQGPVTSEPPTAIANVAGEIPTPTIAPLPTVGAPPGPRDATTPPKPASSITAVQPHPNLTVEPPIARRPSAPLPLPAATTEPPLRVRVPEPVKIGPPPRLARSSANRSSAGRASGRHTIPRTDSRAAGRETNRTEAAIIN